MALQVINTLVGGGSPGLTVAATDSLLVGQSGTIYSSGYGVESVGNSQTFTIAGTILSTTNDGLHLGSDASSNVRVVIAATGHISAADDCISVSGNNANIQNYGSLSGNFGIYITSGNASNVATIFNAGSIHAEYTGILSQNQTTSVNLTNEGLIRGGDDSFLSDIGTDTLINNGRMIGGIFLGGGNDLYSGAHGRVDGLISGGEGLDTFVVGAGHENIDGGAGLDTLDFTKTGGLRVALDGSVGNTGVAAGDIYVGIEIVKGSVSGADSLTGNSVNNTLYGFGGVDFLSGGGGDDGLVGGAGKDVLYGGAGNDRFFLFKPSEGGDKVNDFTNLPGNNDTFRISASGFGAGLVAGALNSSQFRARADNHAQDANDHFIFRTTDKTLWFDANGSAAGGLTLLADLQNTAPTLTATDILLI